MEITFEHPLYLLFLLFIPLLAAVHFYSLYYVKQRAMRFANFEALERVVQVKAVVPKNYLLLAIRMLVLVGFTLAASGVVFHYEDTHCHCSPNSVSPSILRAMSSGVKKRTQ